MMMDGLLDHITSSYNTNTNTYLSDGNIKKENVKDATHTDSSYSYSNANFGNIVKTESSSEIVTPSSYAIAENFVKTENLPDSCYIIPDVNIKVEEMSAVENPFESFIRSNSDVTEIVKSDCSYETQVPFINVNMKVEENVKYESSFQHCTDTDIKLEEDIKADISSVPESHLECTDYVQVKMKETITTECSHDTHVNDECEVETKAETTPIQSPMVKLGNIASHVLIEDERCETSHSQSIQTGTSEMDGGDGWEVTLKELHKSLVSEGTSQDSSSSSSRKKLSVNSDEKSQIKTHTGKREYHCITCGEVFSYKYKLQHHIKTTHEGGRRFECVICEKKFSHNGNLNVHMRTHTKEKPYECLTCEKTFITKHVLDVHMRTHSGEKPFQCPNCQMAFRTKHVLESHIRTHTGEKPFKCGRCGKQFSRNDYLKAHIGSHTGDKAFACGVCGKQFSKHSDIILHTRTHT